MGAPFTFPVAQATPYDNSDSGLVAENVKDAIDELKQEANVAVFTIPLVYNGTISSDVFISYSNLTPNSPIIVPVNAAFTGFTFSNSRTGADYTIEFRKNTTTGTPFFSVSKTNTQFFAQSVPDEIFSAGDIITVKYVDDGDNANDVVIILGFRAIP
jgi:hypothetical protein